jgi:hypothetical protein
MSKRKKNKNLPNRSDRNNPRASSEKAPVSITLRAPELRGIRLRGFKSHRDKLELEIRPLTILAGENSGGKSSVVQPLLLMKQTLEAQHDPDVLQLNGACIKVDEAKDLFWLGRQDGLENKVWTSGIFDGLTWTEMDYAHGEQHGLKLIETRLTNEGKTLSLRDDTSPNVIIEGLRSLHPLQPGRSIYDAFLLNHFVPRPVVGRCSHRLVWYMGKEGEKALRTDLPQGFLPELSSFSPIISAMIHLPGLRGNPERSYLITRVSDRFPGPFQHYTASVLDAWREANDPRFNDVGKDLQHLQSTWRVHTQRKGDTHVELHVARLPRPSGDEAADSKDVVNIADVGFGASQVLPVVVALRAAARGQLVHIEQPELHLHPNAQVKMADLLINAARRGVRLIVETHSSVLLTAIQVAVAEDTSNATRDLVAMHWFWRDPDGISRIKSAELQSDGTYGSWPVNFADVEMDIQRRFIKASFDKQQVS